MTGGKSRYTKTSNRRPGFSCPTTDRRLKGDLTRRTRLERLSLGGKRTQSDLSSAPCRSTQSRYGDQLAQLNLV